MLPRERGMAHILRRCYLYEKYLNEVEAMNHPEAFAYTKTDECHKLSIFFGHGVPYPMAERYRCVCFVCNRITSKKSGWNEHLFPRRAAHRTTGKFGSQSKFNRLPVCGICNVPWKIIYLARGLRPEEYALPRMPVPPAVDKIDLGYQVLTPGQRQLLGHYWHLKTCKNLLLKAKYAGTRLEQAVEVIDAHWPEHFRAARTARKILEYQTYVRQRVPGWDLSATIPQVHQDALEAVLQCDIAAVHTTLDGAVADARRRAAWIQIPDHK
jgi:hypothetical protein